MDNAPRSARWWFAAALLLAVVVRVAWLGDKPFWRDEASVALLAESPLGTVIDARRPRPVPIGFIALTKASGLLPLTPEVAYRLVPLAAGLALVPLLARLAAALGAPPPVPLLVVWLAAALPALVYYSRELKSYDLDALLATLAPLLALRLFGRDARPAAETAGRPGAGLGLCLLFAVAPWISFGSAFALSALLLWGWGRWAPAAAPRARVWWAAASAVYALSFAVALRVALAPQSTSPGLHHTWRGWHLDDGTLVSALKAVGRFLDYTTRYGLYEIWMVAVPLALLGAWGWPRAQRATLLWLYVGTGALTVAATLAGRYLLADGRLLLAALPPLLLATAQGLALVATRLAPRHARAAALAVVVPLALAWSARALVARQQPHPQPYFVVDVLHDVGALLDRAAAVVPAGEPLYVGDWASRPFNYYVRTRGGGRFADATVCWEPCDIATVTNAWLDALPGRGWMLLTDDQRELYRALLAARGITPQEGAVARGAVLWSVQR